MASLDALPPEVKLQIFGFVDVRPLRLVCKQFKELIDQRYPAARWLLKAEDLLNPPAAYDCRNRHYEDGKALLKRLKANSSLGLGVRSESKAQVRQWLLELKKSLNPSETIVGLGYDTDSDSD
jgi:hypothetical protein